MEGETSTIIATLFFLKQKQQHSNIIDLFHLRTNLVAKDKIFEHIMFA